MPQISVDFSDVGSGFEPVPEGRYSVVVEEVSLQTSQETGNPYLKWTLKITDGPFEGRKLWTNMVLIEKSLWVLRASLEALGHDFEENPEINFEVDDDTDILVEPEVMGLPACVDVYNTVYRQRAQNNVDILLPISEYEAGPVMTKKSGTTLTLNKKKSAPAPQKKKVQKVVEEEPETEEEEVVEEVVDEEEEVVEKPVSKPAPTTQRKPAIRKLK